MANRREFIQAGVAMSAVLLPGAAALAGTPRPLPLYKVIYDQRSAAATMFGAEARRLGAQVQDLQGGLDRLWNDDLYHRWKTGQAPVAGMTDYNTMFVLGMLAQDARMRVIYRAHHRSAAGGRMQHEAFGPLAAVGGPMQPGFAGANWPQAMARTLVSWPESERMVARASSSIADANQRLVAPGTMVSWIIAPPRRVTRV